MAFRLTPDNINTLLLHHHNITLKTLNPGIAERAALLARAVLLLLAHRQDPPDVHHIYRQATLTALFQAQDMPLSPPVREALRDYLTALPGICLHTARPDNLRLAMQHHRRIADRSVSALAWLIQNADDVLSSPTV